MTTGVCTRPAYRARAVITSHQYAGEVVTQQPRWATEQEAADHARISPSTLRRWRAQNLITGHKVGRTVRYDLNEIDQQMLAGTQETAQ